MDSYLILKAFHLISMVAWFAALFYLPRLYVYHVEHPEAAPTLRIMEEKLTRFILRPAALATWGFGLAIIAYEPSVMQMGWLHAKLFLVFLLTAYHGSLEAFLVGFRQGRNTRSGRFFRLYNEIPTVLLFGIIFLAVLKPF